MRIPRFLALLSLATLILCGASFADQILSLGPFTGADIGTTATFSNGIGSVTVSGFSANSTPTQIFSKNGGGDEDGLGVDGTGDGDKEISGTAFLQFTAAGINSAVIGSAQTGEGWELVGSTANGVLGTTVLFSGTGGEQVSITGLLAKSGGFTYVDLAVPVGNGGNILLDSLDTPDARVPEPGTTAMIMTLGLVGLFEVGRRKLMA
jgi:hypothetical protein